MTHAELKHYEVQCDQCGCEFRRVVVCRPDEIPEKVAGLTCWDLGAEAVPRFYWLCADCVRLGSAAGLTRCVGPDHELKRLSAGTRRV